MIKHNTTPEILPSRVVILGSSGFVGRHLDNHLKSLGIETVSLTSSEVDLSAGDAAENLSRIIRDGDALVFLSALTPEKGRDIATLMRNLRMGENVSASLKDSECSHIIYISSDAVYDDGAELITETTGANPSSFHGVMHLTRERMLAHTAGDAGLPLLILRPSLLYGPDDTHNGYGPNRFLSTAKNDGVITLFGNGEEKRDHVYIADLARLIGLSLMSRTEGVLNVATGVSVSFFDVAQTIAGLGEKKVEIECLPRAMPITHRHFDTADGIKAFSSFQYTPVQSGIPETYDKLGAAHK